MTTIREELRTAIVFDSDSGSHPFYVADVILARLGIDPDVERSRVHITILPVDVPPEWGDDDRCLTWLRERQHAVRTQAFPAGEVRVIVEYGVNGRVLVATGAPTLHAALIAACQAVALQAIHEDIGDAVNGPHVAGDFL